MNLIVGETYTFVFGQGVNALTAQVVALLDGGGIEVKTLATATQGGVTHVLNPAQIIYLRPEQS